MGVGFIDRCMETLRDFSVALDGDDLQVSSAGEPRDRYVKSNEVEKGSAPAAHSINYDEYLFGEYDIEKAKLAWSSGKKVLLKRVEKLPDSLHILFPVIYQSGGATLEALAEKRRVSGKSKKTEDAIILRVKFDKGFYTKTKYLIGTNLFGGNQQLKIFREDTSDDVIDDQKSSTLNFIVPSRIYIDMVEFVQFKGGDRPLIHLGSNNGGEWNKLGVWLGYGDLPGAKGRCKDHGGHFFEGDEAIGEEWCHLRGSIDIFDSLFPKRVKQAGLMKEYDAVEDLETDEDKLLAMFDLGDRIFNMPYTTCRKDSDDEKKGSCWTQDQLKSIKTQTLVEIDNLYRAFYTNSNTSK